MKLFKDFIKMQKKEVAITFNETLTTNNPTDGIVVKINSRKLQLIREKSYRCYPHWAMGIKY